MRSLNQGPGFLEKTRPHEQVAAFIVGKLNIEVDRQEVPYLLSYCCLIRLQGTETAFCPAVIVLNQPPLAI